MEEVKKKLNGVDDSKEECYRYLLQEVKRLARFDLIRKMDTYKQLSRYFLYKHHDWREEFNKFLNQGSNKVLCQTVKGILNPAYKRVFKDFTETEFWFALLGDPNYRKDNRDILLEDWFKWEIENGTGYTSERAKESLARLFSIYEREKQTETKETIERDDYLLNLFQKNEAIYDKFFERCEGKEKINIVIELIAVAIAIKSEDEYTAYLLERGKNLITLHEELSKHFVLAGYASFAKAISEYKSIPKERQYKINNAKKEYQKLLS